MATAFLPQLRRALRNIPDPAGTIEQTVFAVQMQVHEWHIRALLSVFFLAVLRISIDFLQALADLGLGHRGFL